MPNQTDGPIRSNCRWTPPDDERLRMLYPDHTVPIETVAAALHRTAASVGQRAGQLGLTRTGSTSARRRLEMERAYLSASAIEQVVDLLDVARSQIRPNGDGGVVLTRADHEMVLRQLDRADEILLDCLG